MLKFSRDYSRNIFKADYVATGDSGTEYSITQYGSHWELFVRDEDTSPFFELLDGNFIRLYEAKEAAQKYENGLGELLDWVRTWESIGEKS